MAEGVVGTCHVVICSRYNVVTFFNFRVVELKKGKVTLKKTFLTKILRDLA